MDKNSYEISEQTYNLIRLACPKSEKNKDNIAPQHNELSILDFVGPEIKFTIGYTDYPTKYYVYKGDMNMHLLKVLALERVKNILIEHKSKTTFFAEHPEIYMEKYILGEYCEYIRI